MHCDVEYMLFFIVLKFKNHVELGFLKWEIKNNPTIIKVLLYCQPLKFLPCFLWGCCDGRYWRDYSGWSHQENDRSHHMKRVPFFQASWEARIQGTQIVWGLTGYDYFQSNICNIHVQIEVILMEFCKWLINLFSIFKEPLGEWGWRSEELYFIFLFSFLVMRFDCNIKEMYVLPCIV